MEFLKYKKIIFAAGFFLFLFSLPLASAKAANLGDIVNFNVDKSFDLSGRTQISSVLIKITDKLYFYVDKTWWDSQTQAKQSEVLTNLEDLSNEFDDNIYPNLTSVFGYEWNPGIDKDQRITVLFEPMNSTEGGYFREVDEYEKLQVPTSNEREMFYLATANASDSNLKIILAHEFVHLITFNQKNKILGVEEDTWLNEARADYSSTILGYDSNYAHSNLQQRVKDFIESPSDSITDWNNTKYDYASVDLFIHYLVDHYGINILSDSLKLKSVGIASINDALSRAGDKENFSQVFTNWTIALAINDCSQNKLYCYLDSNLQSIIVSPTLIFLPLAGSSSLSSSNVTRNWSGNWIKYIGGSGDLKLDFSSLNGLNFQVPYLVYDKNNNYSVKYLTFGSSGKAQIDIKDFGTNYKSLVIIPSLQTKISDFDGSDLIYPYSFTVSIIGKNSSSDQSLIQNLLAQINSLRARIAALQGNSSSQSCVQLINNLFPDLANSEDVKCLQTFLKAQGTDIYPEGFVTGNFGNLTKQAVVRFQEKYASEVLTPYGLTKGTGYVGQATRTKINQILSQG